MRTLLTALQNHAELAQSVLVQPSAKYLFITNDSFAHLIRQRDFGHANRCYVAELLAHIHIAAVASLRRHMKWMNAILAATSQGNYFVFCAALRGFVESAADAYFSLKLMPGTLAEHAHMFKRCLAVKQTDAMVIWEKVEDLAIHFLQAGKHDDKTQSVEHFKAKQCVEYIESIDEEDTTRPIYRLYQKLCQFSHPSRETAHIFLRQHADGTFSVEDSDDARLIATEIESDVPTYDILVQKSFNASFLTLFFLDALAPTYLPCPPIRDFSFSKVDGFERMLNVFKSA